MTIAGIDRLHANFKANAFSGRIEGGNRYVTPWMGGLGLTPYAAAQVTHSICRLMEKARSPAPTHLR